MTDQRNLVLAIALSIAILLGFQYFVPSAPQKPPPEAQKAGETTAPGQQAAPAQVPGTVPGAPIAPVITVRERAAVLAESPRVAIDGKRVAGSINLKGARIDDVVLKDYHVTVDKKSANITLFSPPGTEHPYYAEAGIAQTNGLKTPGPDTVWTADKQKLTSGDRVTLSWDNGEGQVFKRTIALDDNYMFTITQSVENKGAAPIAVTPYALVSRHGTPVTRGFYILHEGPIGVIGGSLQEPSYSDIAEAREKAVKSTGGWIGITDDYWLAALVPPQDAEVTASFKHFAGGAKKDIYQSDILAQTREVAPGASTESVVRLFAGAKETYTIDAYAEKLGIDRFDRAIDWGWFYWLTKPIFQAMHWLNGVLGNFGLAILALTVVIKLIFFPLAQTSYKAMSKMKILQPELMKLRERYKDDTQRINQEMMALYKKHKVNPAAGCLPIVVQIPVFFALYKVIFTTIEMRHAPFYGWIKDLSAPDPTSWINLFGLLPYDVPNLGPLYFFSLGVWPILMGISMFLQQKLNPQPADPVQAKMFMLMPIFFTFLLGSFAAGLVIYWTWNNLLSIAQQWTIMRRIPQPKTT
ncbi:membrane protein insertase YidC [Desertibaculum subflavum]|uniref:membrane protein insertase YidC n=1 Tax=Desertibaculum subflavum TaxID=2268458 RepID=UPI000E66ED82